MNPLWPTLGQHCLFLHLNFFSFRFSQLYPQNHYKNTGNFQKRLLSWAFNKLTLLQGSFTTNTLLATETQWGLHWKNKTDFFLKLGCGSLKQLSLKTKQNETKNPNKTKNPTKESQKKIPLQHHRPICGLLNHQLLLPSPPGPSGHGWGQMLLLWWRWLWEPVETIGRGRTIKSHCLQTQGSFWMCQISQSPLALLEEINNSHGGKENNQKGSLFLWSLVLKGEKSKRLLGMNSEGL